MSASVVDLLIGSGPGQRVVVIGTMVLYGYLFVRRPEDGKRSIRKGLTMFGRLFTLILAALLVASAIGSIVPADSINQILGQTAGVQGAVLSGLFGGILPGGPYAVYPIVDGVGAAGAGAVAVLAMIVGYGAIGIGRIPYGLVFFDTKTVALRVGIGILATVFVALGLFVVL